MAGRAVAGIATGWGCGGASPVPGPPPHPSHPIPLLPDLVFLVVLAAVAGYILSLSRLFSEAPEGMTLHPRSGRRHGVCDAPVGPDALERQPPRKACALIGSAALEQRGDGVQQDIRFVWLAQAATLCGQLVMCRQKDRGRCAPAAPEQSPRVQSGRDRRLDHLIQIGVIRIGLLGVDRLGEIPLAEVADHRHDQLCRRSRTARLPGARPR